MGRGDRGSLVTPAVGSSSCPNDDDNPLTVDIDDQDSMDVEDSSCSSCKVPLSMDSNDDTSTSSAALDDVSVLKCNKRSNIIIDLDLLMSHINNIATCRHCEATSMNSFVEYCEDRMQEVIMFSKCRFHRGTARFKYTKTAVNVKQWYTDWKNNQSANNSTSKLTGVHTSYGVASDVCVTCSSCNVPKSMLEGKKTERQHETNSDLCKYDVNLRFCVALQLIGVGGEHASVLAAFLNLPFPRKWRRDFNVLENFLYDSVEKTKEDSQHKAMQEEILQTLNDTNHPVEQNMLEEP